MRFLRRYKFVLLFLALLVFCSAMVIRQVEQNQTKHIELREAFILLWSKGYTDRAQRLYDRLLRDLQDESAQILFLDYQRTLQLVDPTTSHPENLIWRYHKTLSNELDARNKAILARALQISEEETK
jgi:hypothetical protein